MWFSTLLLKNLLRRKFRSGLTCIGFAVAVGTTVALLGVSEGFERSWLESMTRRGFDIIVVQGGSPDQLQSSLEESFQERIAQEPGVKAVAPSLVAALGYELIEQDEEGNTFRNSINIILQGWEPNSVMLEEIEIQSGRWHTASDEKVVVLGQQLAKIMEKSVGDKIELEGGEFEVIGIYQSFVVYENGSLVMPIREMQKMMGRTGEVTAFAVVLEDSLKKDEAAIQSVVDRLNQLKLNLPGVEDYQISLSAMASKDYVSNTLYIKLAHAMAWVTSAIAIIVGSIGVLNTMIMSVAERIKEIAILRAIGWKKSRVVRMILGEALILSLLGAILGIGAAVLVVQWLTTLPAVAGFIEGTIAVSVFLKGIVLALVVGLLGGAYPAWHAAQLLPSEGLRHE